MTYIVGYWNRHPYHNNEQNEGCLITWEFETREEADAKLKEELPTYYRTSVAYIGLDGPKGHKIIANPHYKSRIDNGDEWVREQAMQAGMGLGIDAYNDTYGY